MKKIILGLALVASFAACKSKKSELEKTNVVMVQDTFRMYNNSILTDNGAGSAIFEAPARKVKTASSRSKSSSSSANNSTSASSNSSQGTIAQAPVPAKKKGWSNRAKGAAIGAGTGAAAGAIINGRNRGVGAVIGAVVGAAGGYIIGNEMDRKDGRN